MQFNFWSYPKKFGPAQNFVGSLERHLTNNIVLAQKFNLLNGNQFLVLRKTFGTTRNSYRLFRSALSGNLFFDLIIFCWYFVLPLVSSSDPRRRPPKPTARGRSRVHSIIPTHMIVINEQDITSGSFINFISINTIKTL